MGTNRYDPAATEHPRACPFCLGDLSARRHPGEVEVCPFCGQRSGAARRGAPPAPLDQSEETPPAISKPAA